MLSLIDFLGKFDISLPPEVEEGNIEYKVKLVNPSSNRLQHLITQMKWRLREGQGEAIYELGVADDGTMKGLTDTELAASLKTLKAMATALNASIVTIGERDVTPKNSSCCRRVVELLVRKVPDNQQFVELRCKCWKINTMWCINSSSICLDTIGFDSLGKLINYSDHSLEEIAEHSTKLVTLIDLAGDSKYLKTTIYGLTGYLPHFAALVVSAVTGPTPITREHLGLAVALNIPVFVIITKIDVVNRITLMSRFLKYVNVTGLSNVFDLVKRLLERPGMERIPQLVENSDEAINFATEMLAKHVVPIFLISNVSGQNLYLLEQFLNVLSPSSLSKLEQEGISPHAPLFSVEEVYRVPQVGIVVCGMLTNGVLHEKDSIQIGPFKNGSYQIGNIETIRRNKQPVQFIRPGEAASLALTLDENIFDGSIRRGMVVLDAKEEGISCRRFTARLYLFHHPANEICVGFQGTVYVGSVRQTVTIIELDAPSVTACQWVTVLFEFYSCPEYIRVGTPFIFHESKTKGVGEVIQILNSN
ncbi:unnamed protein product [Thelazia callipaeda]|uniref:Tr-type G domain-containing protein n=1 Tax=Thelazia callipaeda TaxID=103827 RepID=A0A0N5CRT0_THECL|nr:unnamed protein product [Thelazia callipaeda]